MTKKLQITELVYLIVKIKTPYFEKIKANFYFRIPHFNGNFDTGKSVKRVPLPSLFKVFIYVIIGFINVTECNE